MLIPENCIKHSKYLNNVAQMTNIAYLTDSIIFVFKINHCGQKSMCRVKELVVSKHNMDTKFIMILD